MSDENNELAAFVLRHGQIKAQLTRFQTFLNEPKSNIITQLRLRAEKIREAWSEFDAIQNNIETLDDSNNDQLQYRSAFEDLYFDLMSQVDDRVSGTNTPAQNRQTIHCDQIEVTKNHNFPLVKLKPVEIPTFTRKFEDWVTFQDIFGALVHTNKSITDIEKFCYLRNALEGEACSLIKNLETSSSNYEIAWKIVSTRYNNTRLLIQTNTKRIFDLEPINKESAVKLKQLTDSLNAHIQALKALNHDPYNWGALLLHVIYTKLDRNSIRQWEVEVSKDDIPSIQLMMEFLGKRSQMLESVENAKLLIFKQNETNYSSTKSSKFITSKRGASKFLTTYKMKCYMCQQPHPIYKCTVFLALDIASRINKVNELKLCNNCLKKSDHQAKQCPARKCGKYQKQHNSLLYQEKEVSSEEGSIQGNSSNDSLMVAHTVDAADNDNQVLLATAIIKISSSVGKNIHGRALLDNGSQSNFITNNLIHKLGLKRHKVNIPKCGISGSKNNIKYKVTAVVQSLNSSYVTTIEFLVLSKITGSLPHTPIRTVSIPDNVNVADPSYNCPGNIDVLIGGDTYWDVICADKLKIIDGPYLQKALFGWVVVGKTANNLSMTRPNTCLLATQNQYNMLETKIEAFWKMEEVSVKNNFTDEEKSCMIHFNENLTQNENGRFIVKLPFKENCRQMGNSYTSALRRFLSLEKRLINNPELYIKYKMFMSEYETLNHMERVYDTGGDKQLIDSAKYFYLPHSYVINDRSRTTKLRVGLMDRQKPVAVCH